MLPKASRGCGFAGVEREVGASEVEQLAAELIPIYPSTGSLKSWDLPKYMRKAVDWLAKHDLESYDPLPPELREREGLTGLGQALREILARGLSAPAARA